MSDQPEQQDETPQSSQPKETPDLVVELREMGQQFEAVFRAAIESERTKQLQRDLVGGVREIASQVQTAVKSLQDNPRLQQAEERGRQVLSQAQQSKLVQDLQETLVTGIGQLNEQLRRLVDRLEQERTGAASQPTTEQVPIENESEPPTTGATTKLDE